MFEVSYRQLVHHHNRGHIEQAVQAAQASSRKARAGATILDSLDDYRARLHTSLDHLETILREASQAKDMGAQIAVIRESSATVRECTRLLELHGKLTGELDTSKYNLFVMPQWFRVRDIIIAALLPFPEATTALLAGLQVHLGKEANRALTLRASAPDMVPEPEPPEIVVDYVPVASGADSA